MNRKKSMKLYKNALIHTDCLTLLERMPNEQITLAYLDPPWRTSHYLNLGLFTSTDTIGDQLEQDGDGFQSYPSTQIPPPHLSVTDQPDNDPEGPYRDFMSRVLQQIHRVLANNGSLYYNHSPSSPLYIRLLLDQIFGEDRLQTQIALPTPYSPIRTGNHSIIIVYNKTESYIKNQHHKPITPDLLARYRFRDEVGDFKLRSLIGSLERPSHQFKWREYELPPGKSWCYSQEALEELEQQGKIYHATTGNLPRLKVYLADSPGIPIGDTWNDISPQLTRNEILEGEPRFGGQQTIAILDRIIKIGSNPGDIVLDPFCGSGTTFVAAHNNNRRWIGCDIAREAYTFTIKRLEIQSGIKPSADFLTEDEQYLIDNFAIIAQTYRAIMTSPKVNRVFWLNQPVSIEEGRKYEFKEIKGAKPIDIIKKQLDEYAVAYLNSYDEGSIFWGIRDADGVVVGVKLERKERDDLNRLVCDKIRGIKPCVYEEMYKLDLHPIYIQNGLPVNNLYVIELRSIPSSPRGGPYSTASGKYYEKTSAGIREIPTDELAAWKENYLNRSHPEQG